MRELGQRLLGCQREAGLSAKELAEKARVPLAALESFERGTGGMGVAALSRVAKVLGVSPGSILVTSHPKERAFTEPTVLLRSAGNADMGDSDRDALASALIRARAFSQAGRLLGVEQLADRFSPSPPPVERPHEAGYEAARKARALLPERPTDLRDLARLIENRFDILVVEHEFAHPGIFGACCRSGSARVIAVAKRIRTETTRRFVLGHELGHHLMDLGAEGTAIDEQMLDGAGFWMESSPTEKRANAFSAMLLAPERAVREVLGQPDPAGYGLEQARQLVRHARESFGVGFAGMAWHLHNLGYIRSPETVHALLVEPDTGDVQRFESDLAHDGLARRIFELREREGLSAARERELLGTSA
ncbi:MAG: ImmA/IrrE family metallo-endopeptidase [Deltaproteobacteria bacterium]|nr:ImmA/IrrE family metallo-endopeptidase [Deltaproteobacteria bacterium]